MKTSIKITRVCPSATIQDNGRFNLLKYGVCASGAMDKSAFELGKISSATSGIEITQAGIDFVVKGDGVKAAFTGADFSLFINGKNKKWGRVYPLKNDTKVQVQPRTWGNYGYIRFNAELDVEPILGSRSTNLTVGLGGINGRAIGVNDEIGLLIDDDTTPMTAYEKIDYSNNIFHFIWGIHADKFSQKTRNKFVSKPFIIRPQINRMGHRLSDKSNVFAKEKILSLVSDPLVAGDIQILGDGTPIVLMRDHQPTGGYPRIGTIIGKDLDRFAQKRPNSEVFFQPISTQRAQNEKD